VKYICIISGRLHLWAKFIPVIHIRVHVHIIKTF